MLEPEEEPTGFPVRDWKKKPEKAKERSQNKHLSWRNAPAFAIFTVVIAFFVLMGMFYASEWASENVFTTRIEQQANLK